MEVIVKKFNFFITLALIASLSSNALEASKRHKLAGKRKTAENASQKAPVHKRQRHLKDKGATTQELVKASRERITRRLEATATAPIVQPVPVTQEIQHQVASSSSSSSSSNSSHSLSSNQEANAGSDSEALSDSEDENDLDLKTAIDLSLTLARPTSEELKKLLTPNIIPFYHDILPCMGELVIYKFIDQPNFNMMRFYRELPKDSRERVLTVLRQKATNMVAQKSDQELKAIFAQLPEGWFKMEVRQAYHKLRRELIDEVPIDFIMEQINSENGRIDFQGRDLVVSHESIKDLVVIRSETHLINYLSIPEILSDTEDENDSDSDLQTTNGTN